jgi:hypothetical protein
MPFVDTNDIYPAQGAFAITKDDNVIFNTKTRSVYIGGDGDLKVRMVSGEVVTFTGLVAGMIMPIAIDKVLEDTTATNLIGLY